MRLVVVTYRDIFQWLTRHQGMDSEEFSKASAVVRLCPQDMQALGVADKQQVKLSTAHGAIVAKVKADPGCPAGFGYVPASAYVNQLASYDSSRNLPDFKHMEVEVEATEQKPASSHQSPDTGST